MRFQGRHIDPVALWSEYVEFPANFSDDGEHEFAPLVVCPNPDHHTEKRHFQINLREPLVHCFANCGISGTYENAVAMVEGVKPREARKRILRHSRIGPVVRKKSHKSRTTEPISPDLLVYDRYIPPFGLEYLQSRGISGASITKWELGWDADERRIVIPVKDARNRTRLLIRRAVREKDHPKYLYTEGVERNSLIYGIGQIDLGMVQSFGIVLVEGSIDAWVMHQHEYSTTVAILGSKLSEFQAKQIMNLRPKRVFCMFDADGAGISATNSAIYLLKGIPISVVRYPKGYTDPGMTVEFEKSKIDRMIGRAVSTGTFHRMVRESQTRSTTRRKGISVG